MTPTATATTLPIAEVFGPTFQGEGPSSGKLASFVRLGGCNLTCHGCDTKFTWDASQYDLRAELTQMTVDEIMAGLAFAPLVVITGGEPLMYQRREVFHQLVRAIIDRGSHIEIETNGTIAPDTRLTARPEIAFNVSPKLDGPMSTDPTDRRIVPAALAEFAARSRTLFKFVVATPEDVAAAVTIADQAGMPRRRVWVMPEGTKIVPMLDRARVIADTALAAGVNLTLRQHVLIWPKTERGR